MPNFAKFYGCCDKLCENQSMGNLKIMFYGTYEHCYLEFAEECPLTMKL
jgi:hypothetical protein